MQFLPTKGNNEKEFEYDCMSVCSDIARIYWLIPTLFKFNNLIHELNSINHDSLQELATHKTSYWHLSFKNPTTFCL